MIHACWLLGVNTPGRNMSGSLRNDSTEPFTPLHCKIPFVSGLDSVRATLCGVSAFCNCSVSKYRKTKKRRHAAAATGFPGSPKNAVSRPLQASIEKRIGWPGLTAALWKTVRPPMRFTRPGIKSQRPADTAPVVRIISYSIFSVVEMASCMASGLSRTTPRKSTSTPRLRSIVVRYGPLASWIMKS